MTGWLIDIIPTERPSDVMDAPEAYRAAWGRYVGEVVPGDGDPEDWREQAARLEAAARILPDPHVRVAGRSYGGPDPMTLAHYGVVRIRPYMDQLTLPASNVDRWDLIPALRPFLGRDVQSVPCDGDAIDVAARGMLDRHPGAGVVVKFMLREKRLPLAFIDPDGTFEQSDEYGGKPERIPFAAWRWAGYDLALFEGEPDAALVQQRVRMRYEYRVQVIGGEPVCDPACGSGNFLTETYLELRRIENRILADLDKDGQLALDLGDDLNPVRVSISHFHGIEINGFACAVARTALWIAEQQALDDTESTISGLPRLPFTDTAHIRQGNALRLDWNELLPGDHCDYVMGNPPFIGQYLMSDSQKEDMRLIWDKGYDGYLDYATGWHRKASEYLAKPGAAFAFVSTNSISQGQPVPSLFRPLFDEGWRIRFAHRTFAWDAQSTDNAHVHVVIVGMDKTSEPAPILFEYTDIDGEPAARTVDNINGYLLDGPNVFVEKRMKPLSSELSPAGRGSQPTDGGNLILDGRKEYDRAMSDPIAAKYVRPFRMGRELINGTNRWCLWMPGVEPSEIKSSSFLRDRVDAVKETRLASRKAVTRGKAMTAWLFDENHQPSTRYLAIPAVFSGRREYATCDWYTSDIIAGNKIYTCADPDGLAFAVIESCMFMTWQKAIGGRLKSDPNFSNTVVWNNLPLPALDDDTRAALIEAGRNVLAARANHPGQSLADLYDPDYMPTDLRAAHRELDKIADVAFGARKWLKDDDDTRLQVLFKSYTRMTGSSEV